MIKIRLEKWERAVIMQVLEMDESLRGVGMIYESVKTNMQISSYDGPDITERGVFLRGEIMEDDYGELVENDYDIVSQSFATNEERDIYYDKVVRLFAEWKKSIGISDTVQDNIISF